MARKLITASTAVVFTIGVVGVVGGGVASAKGGPPAPIAATGTTTCNYHGTLAVSATGTVTLRGAVTPHHVRACSSTGGTKLKTGHLSGLASTATITGICSILSGGSLPDLSGGTIRWAPKRTAASSTGVALTGGSLSVVTVGTDSFLQVAYTSGSVASGSFTGGASMTATSRQTTTELTAECANGPVDAIGLTGSLTL